MNSAGVKIFALYKWNNYIMSNIKIQSKNPF